jgi:hypothetical protein
VAAAELVDLEATRDSSAALADEMRQAYLDGKVSAAVVEQAEYGAACAASDYQAAVHERAGQAEAAVLGPDHIGQGDRAGDDRDTELDNPAYRTARRADIGPERAAELAARQDPPWLQEVGERYQQAGERPSGWTADGEPEYDADGNPTADSDADAGQYEHNPRPAALRTDRADATPDGGGDHTPVHESGSWLARDGDTVREVAADGIPGREASPDDARPVVEAAEAEAG